MVQGHGVAPEVKLQATLLGLHHGLVAKKVVFDSPGLVDFAIGLVNSVFNLPNGQVIFFLGIRITEEL